MSTWHQRQRTVRLYHETLWTVVIDPPEQTMCLVLCETYEKAKVLCDKSPHSFIIRPANSIIK